MVKPTKQAKPTKAGTSKQRVRGLERLLARGTLPPDVRAAKERELASLKGDVQKQNRVSREKHFSKKYHGVKFIERRKVERRIGNLQRRISELETDAPRDAAGKAALQDELREAEHDLLYIRHFPRSKKYLSLFPTTDGENEYVAKRRRRIRAIIVRRVEAGLPVGHMDEDDGDDEQLAAAAAAADGAAASDDDVDADDFFAAAPADEVRDEDEEEDPPAPAPAARREEKKPKKKKSRDDPPGDADDGAAWNTAAPRTKKSKGKKDK